MCNKLYDAYNMIFYNMMLYNMMLIDIILCVTNTPSPYTREEIEVT